MSCPVDHSLLVGKSFCTSCGEKIVPTKRNCANGHEISATLKFCTECGLPVQVDVQKSDVIEPIQPRTPNIRVAPVETTAPVSNYNTYAGTTGAYAQPSESSFSRLPEPDPMNTGVNNPIVRYIAIGIGILIIAAFGISKIGSTVATTDVTVNMTLVGETCSNVSWGYDDIPGGTVNLSIDGVPQPSTNYTSYGVDVYNGCKFTATVSGVKENGNSYTVTSGRMTRGEVTNSQTDLASNSWTFELSLGG